MKPNLLIVDDEEHTRDGLELALEDEFEVFCASSAKEAEMALNQEDFQVVLTDLRMPGESGMNVIDIGIRHPSNPLCIMMTAYGEVDVAVEAMKRGAFDFLPKPVNLEQLEFLIKRGLKERNLEQENQHLHQRIDKKFSFDGIMGKSAALESVLEKVRLVGPSKATFYLLVKLAQEKSCLPNLFIKIAIGQGYPLSLFIVQPYHPIYWKVNYLVMKKGLLQELMKEELEDLNLLTGELFFSTKLERLILLRK